MRVFWCSLAVLMVVVVWEGCNHEPGSTILTRGNETIACDEAVYATFVREVEEFQSNYPDAKLRMRETEAREAVSLFGADSVRMMVTARELNAEERAALKNGKIPVDEYKVALSAVAVIVHPGNPLSRIRMTQLDSVYSGKTLRWPGGKVIEAYAGGKNSSTNELFRARIMEGRPFGPTIDYVDSSAARVERVASSPSAIGLVPVAWLKGKEGVIKVLEVGGPAFQPDTTSPPGQYYTPAPAYVFLERYPILAPVYMYSREVEQNVALGFIAYVASAPGQKVIQNSGLVPTTMPVRLVSITSEQVH